MAPKTLYITSHSSWGMLTNPRWFVCTEKPFKYGRQNLDAPFLYSSSHEQRATAYARSIIAQSPEKYSSITYIHVV